jgi:pimeloyl-ACP methyl ester carboxylesterase
LSDRPADMSAAAAGPVPPDHLLTDDECRLPDGPCLALRRAAGDRRPFLLVHGLASNARVWDGVARRLAAVGHEVVAVDLRGHGRSESPADGYHTDGCADDLDALLRLLGLTGARAPIAAGQSWGGNVVVSLSARHGTVAGVALVDGGWISLGESFATFEDCWTQLAPPDFPPRPLDEVRAMFRRRHPDWPAEGIEGTLGNFAVDDDGNARPALARDHHREIVHSLWSSDVTRQLPQVTVPALLAPAVADGDERRSGPERALSLLPDAEVSWYSGADHDLHVQHPDRLAADLVALAARVEAGAP